MSTQSPAGDLARKSVPPAPHAAASSASPARTARPAPRPLLSDIMVEHGPVDLLGRFFLKADTAARRRDVTLSFAPMQDLMDANRRNRQDVASAAAAVRSGKRRHHGRGQLLHRRPQRPGRHRGDAGRAALSTGTDTTFHDEARSLRLFYADPARLKKAERERSRSRRLRRRRITGRVVFAGGAGIGPTTAARQLRLDPAAHLARLRLHALAARLPHQHHGRGGLQAAACPSAAATPRSTGR